MARPNGTSGRRLVLVIVLLGVFLGIAGLIFRQRPAAEPPPPPATRPQQSSPAATPVVEQRPDTGQ